MPISRRIPPEELAQYSSEIAGLNEARRWALYDRLTWAAAAVVSGTYKFFSVPLGQGAVPKTLLDTNLRQASMLPARQALEVWDIGLHVKMTVVSDDDKVSELNDLWENYNAIIHGAFLELKNAQKVEVELAPIAKLPPGIGADGFAWGGTNITAAADTGGGAAMFTNGSPNRAALWNLAPLPIVLLPQRTFEVDLTFPAAITLPTGVGMYIWCYLDGVLHRSA